MRHGINTTPGFGIYLLVFASIVALIPNLARSGAYTSDPFDHFTPRWSNSQHHEYGLIIRPDCVALPPGAGAEYIPGRDPWGRPIIPAEPPKGFSSMFPAGVGVGVKLGTKQIAGRDIELYGGTFAFDPATNQFSFNGPDWRRDCLPPPK